MQLMIYFYIIVNLCIRDNLAGGIGKCDLLGGVPGLRGPNMKTAENLRSKANPLSKLFFCWTLPLFWRGLQRDLGTSDLGVPLASDISGKLADKLEANWFLEIEKAFSKKRKPRLLRALTKTFVCSYLFDGFLVFIQYVVCKSFQPLLLAMLLSYFTGQCSQQDALIYAGGVVALSLANAFIQHHTTLRQQQLGMRVRIACCSLLYRKLLRLSTTSMSQTTAGQVINLLSNDVNRFDSALKFLHILWVAPIQICVCCYLYYHRVSAVALLGVFCILLQTVPVQAYVSKITAKLRRKIAERTDERVRLMDEIICGIQVIKMYAWETPFEDAVSEVRNNELKFVSKAACLRAITSSFIVFTERTSLYVSLLGHVLLGYHMDAPMVYSLAQFYNMLQNMLAYVYPNAVSASVECLVSVKRIQEFLLLEEKYMPALMGSLSNGKGIENKSFEPTEKYRDTHIVPFIQSTKVRPSTPEGDYSINLVQAGATWGGCEQQNISDLTIRIKPGTLVVVIGQVGSGKSSLLQLLLKELPHNSGVVSVKGSVSYACQEPWLFVSTIRNNILFGQTYDPKKYRNVVHVCALEQDFQQFPRGDQTLVGERGVSLSGGQRARINLARAVYRQADIYLLDDPLSGVDAPVGNHLFHACIREYLRGKTRILVTHQLHYLKSADVIIIMNNGRIENTGTYEELERAGLDFTGFLEITAAPGATKEEVDKVLSPTKSIREISRRISVASTGKMECEEKEPVAQEEEAEILVSGRMQASVFWKYWSVGRRPCLLVVMVVALTLSQLTASMSDYWVTYWTNQHTQNQLIMKQLEDLFLTGSTGNLEPSYGILNYELNPEYNHTIETFMKKHNLTGPKIKSFSKTWNKSSPMSNLSELIGPWTTLQYLYVYSALILICIIVTILGTTLFFKACIKSSEGLHRQVFSRILRARMSFFDRNPSGRILNRFSKDMGTIDEMMPKDMMEAIQIMVLMASALVMVSITNRWLLIPTGIVLGLFYLLISMYLSTAQDIKRLEGITKSPVFSHACATIKGIATIRSSGAQERLTREFDAHQDVHTAAWYQFLASRCTLAFWLDIVCIMFVMCVTFSFIFFNDGSILSGHVGLAISQSLVLTSTFQFGVKQVTEVVAHLTSVERVLQYINVEQEQGLHKGDKPTPKNWPSGGSVTFKQVNLSYNDGDKPVLEDLNFHIDSGWKVGIVGRTGAGKSSLISALFRLAKVEGSIVIDGLDMNHISLQDLRSNISIIPQEPILFSSTMRRNLDPFEYYDDAALWNALESVDLKDAVPSLDFLVSEGGSNFSMGQKQLVCLARAILRNSKILVLDEATASMDQQTDHFIQRIIREKFFDCTVLTIAHRLNTVMDADRVIVMEKGRLVEFGSPLQLLRQHGFLYRMVTDSGQGMATSLMTMARESCKEEANSELDGMIFGSLPGKCTT